MFEFIGIITLVAFIAAGIFSTEMDSAIMSIGTFVIALLVLQYVFDVAVWATIIANPLLVIGLFFANIVLGGMYTAVWRWPEHIRNNKEQIMSAYHNWAMDQKNGQPNSFDHFLESKYYDFNASSHKEALTTWVFMWMFSLTWELSRKPAVWIAKTVYDAFGGLFQKIGRNTARKLHDKK